MELRKNIEDYKPFGLVFGSKSYVIDEEGNCIRNIFHYERSWFCKETGNIHHSEKSVLNCPYCSKKYYKPENN